MRKIFTTALSFSFFCFLTTGLRAQSPGDLMVVEIMRDPLQVSDSLGEWFEIYNKSSSPIPLNGWIISDNGVDRDTLATSFVIQPCGYASLVGSPGTELEFAL